SSVTVTGNFSDAGSADTHTLAWQVVNGSGQVVASGNGANFTFTPPLAGVYTATFTVTDDDGGQGSASVMVTATPASTTLSVQIGAPTGGVRGQSLHFSLAVNGGSETGPAGGYTYIVIWGDGTEAQVLKGQGAAMALNHVFTKTGSFAVQVSAADSLGHALGS